MLIKKILGHFIILERLIEFLRDRFWGFFMKRAMGKCGSNVMIKPSTSVFKGVSNFYFEGDLKIARYAVIYSTNANVIIGKKVDVAPYLKIISGNHRIDKVGHFMFNNDYPKKPENDRDVVIEGDNWLGINVTILAGVTIGRGAIVSAGAVVSKSCPPYAIIGGVPSKILKYRFSIDEILEHEKKLYPNEKRYTENELIAFRDKH